jgi:predicted small lipoprotein YifL
MRARLTVLIAAAALAGCGGSDNPAELPEDVPVSAKQAQTVDVKAFPAVDGRGLDDIAAEFDTAGPQAILATSVFRVGENRLAFGLLDENLKFVYGKTVIYVEPDGGDVQGPIAAPADVLLTQPRYRSRQAATEADPFVANYEALMTLDEAGLHRALVVSDLGAGKRIAATLDFEVKTAKADRIPDVGEPAPKVRTDTLASVKGDETLLDTRDPAAPELHTDVFAEVVGKKPLALLFATPALCQSRVCGPVVDEALQLKASYGDRISFIHQEVFKGNDPNKGLREPLARYNLQTEPWLFTVRADGTIAARLEGSFGLRAFERALKAAL